MQISGGDHVRWRAWSSSTRNKLNLGLGYELKIHVYLIKDGQWLKLQAKADPVSIGAWSACPLLISTGFLKYPLELKKKFSYKLHCTEVSNPYVGYWLGIWL